MVPLEYSVEKNVEPYVYNLDKTLTNDTKPITVNL
jgi:hypothetical protein